MELLSGMLISEDQHFYFAASRGIEQGGRGSHWWGVLVGFATLTDAWCPICVYSLLLRELIANHEDSTPLLYSLHTFCQVLVFAIQAKGALNFLER
jgi:hypothetical protein